MRTVKGPQSCGDRERGYALVSLLALMSLLALFALAVAPRVQQQTQREWEKEALSRGDQVADAIRAYYESRGAQGVNSLPTSMDQLIEGEQVPGSTKRMQILRPSGAGDPLS
jgi:type II secretory pathway pseudopilin PulG